MGISPCLNNRRMKADGGWAWYGSHYNQEYPPYWVLDIDANNWVVLGNN
jgi:hypothetical protein